MPPSTPSSLSASPKLAFIVPSSNTAVEALTISMLHSLPKNITIIPIFTRIRVQTLGTDPSSLAQFNNTETFTTASQLLSDAQPAAILWNGASGMFVGGALASDQALARAMSDATPNKTPCSTTTLATCAALEFLGIRDISIAVPYTPELTKRVSDFFTNEGYTVHSACCMDTTPASNIDIATCSPEEIREVIRRSVVPGKTQAVLVACTNWPAAPLVAELEAELGVCVLDSVAVTLWHGLRMIGAQGSHYSDSMKQWGKLFSP
ncbi:Hypothetical predicted protein [Lecanosticta acicola]|uniref:Asp/Glu racemase n=1 Tax=Lecanosticta acicola TaxID=111012 RepID=A0AAI8Z8W2_9PEZI|nr:Hypothetical predicted protein [Lecanosticta acicola]